MKKLLLSVISVLLFFTSLRAEIQSNPIENPRVTAEQESVQVQSNFGVLRSENVLEKNNDVESFKKFQLMAAAGIALGQNNLGEAYANGKGVAKNNQEAVTWYRLAAQHGLAKAQYNLGIMYERGLGVPQNLSLAVQWYRLAAAQTDITIRPIYAIISPAGDGITSITGDILKDYLRSATKGIAVAQNNLGAMYEMGIV